MDNKKFMASLAQVAMVDMESKGEWERFLLSLDRVNGTMQLFRLVNEVLEKLPFWLSRVAEVKTDQREFLGSSEVFAMDFIQHMAEVFGEEASAVSERVSMARG